ncbi:MAG: radical SAM protein [Elusimicrobiota bacterium]|nr:radical SAM protein [Endomicrobiia bacterium]MDW8166561.1 radical SAM protein [Elusimicrobiota bacterium]
MEKLHIPKPISCGIFLTYRCSAICRHCVYASSPKWSSDFLDKKNVEILLKLLSKWLPKSSYITFNAGIHFSGGEPFLNFDLLVEFIKIAKNYNIFPVLVETNCFWAKDKQTSIKKLSQLKSAGLDGILLSINPFVIEYVKLKNIKIAYETSLEIFGYSGVILYQDIFYEILQKSNISSILKFEEFIQKFGHTPLKYMELLPMGRATYKLQNLFKKYPKETFFHENCLKEFQNPYHIHIDNYGNYIPSFCAGISLNNIFETKEPLDVNLKEKPIISALCKSLEELYYIAKQFNYQQKSQGYISKCDLCLDIRKQIISKTDEFKELTPKDYYYNL